MGKKKKKAETPVLMILKAWLWSTHPTPSNCLCGQYPLHGEILEVTIWIQSLIQKIITILSYKHQLSYELHSWECRSQNFPGYVSQGLWETNRKNLKKIAVTQKQWICNHMSRSKWPLHSPAHCIYLLHYSVTMYGTCVLLKLHVILGYIYKKKKSYFSIT